MSTQDREPFEKQAREERRRTKGKRPDSERQDNLGNIIGVSLYETINSKLDWTDYRNIDCEKV